MLINALDRLSAVKIHFYNLLCCVRAPLPATSWFMAIDVWKKKKPDSEIESLSCSLVHLIFISTFISELLLKTYISALPFFPRLDKLKKCLEKLSVHLDVLVKKRLCRFHGPQIATLKEM